jgi:hypothetical protein
VPETEPLCNIEGSGKCYRKKFYASSTCGGTYANYRE